VEIFECQNCYKRDVLDTHGRCSHCGSNAVASINLMSVGETLEILSDLFTTDELRTLFGVQQNVVPRA
jgi:hypothetical protein